jgi:hypothetical protein
MRLGRLGGKTLMVIALTLAYSLSGARSAVAFQGGGCGMEVVGENLRCDIDVYDVIEMCWSNCGCVGLNWECSWCNDSDDCWLSCGCIQA